MIKVLEIALWAAVPLLEQRWAIPNGILIQKMNPFVVFLAAYIGSLLPVPFIMLLFDKLFDILGRYKIFAWAYRIVEKKIEKNREKFEKYKEPALITFIAIPLPTTGVWTGTVIAAFLKFDFKKSMFCAAVGALGSAILITLLTVFIPSLLGY
ncbi:small multi-drug export protein [Hathewaya histolytica]|uniref:Small multi-drug export protein n=1 Tax=Hathewaya histolytica TaxID=1498 RepID=A0A4U9R4U7_HATHI|nr:small multi-drug export protein [Hathewaya histolytica]VTQ83720.1 small multi-drug export protein [Hathewaya histolytica]